MQNTQPQFTIGDRITAWRPEYGDASKDTSGPASINDIRPEAVPEIVKREELSPEFLDLELRIAEYENLVIRNATLSENADGDFIPRRQNVVGRQREQIKQIKEGLSADVAAILRSAKDATEMDQIVQRLRVAIDDPILRGELLNHRAIISHEKDLEQKVAAGMDHGQNEPLKNKEVTSTIELNKVDIVTGKTDTSFVPGAVDIASTDIHLDTPDLGDSFLVSEDPDKVMLNGGDDEFKEGLEERDRLGSDGESSHGLVDYHRIAAEREHAKLQVSKKTKEDLAEMGIGVSEAESLDNSPVEIGYDNSNDASSEISSSVGQERIAAIKTGFNEAETEGKKPAPDAGEEFIFPEPGAAKIDKIKNGLKGEPKTEEFEPTASAEEKETAAEAKKPDNRKTKFEETVKRIDEQSIASAMSATEAKVDASANQDEKPVAKGFFKGVWSQIAGNKQVGSDVLARLEKGIMKAREVAEKTETAR